LPPTIDPADTIESADTKDVGPTDEIDFNEGAGPYLRTILGPWAR
jgi:hypothetical protein